MGGSNRSDQSKFDLGGTARSPATAFLDERSGANDQRPKWLSTPSGRLGSVRTSYGRTKYERLCDKNLPEVLRREVYSHVFSKLPLRVIHLRDRKLQERNAVAEYLTSSEVLQIGIEKIQTKKREAFQAQPTMTPIQRDRLQDKVVAEWVEDVTRFAILSHTWEGRELSYQDIHAWNDFLGSHSYSLGTDQCTERDRSFKKLLNFCNIAKEYGTEYAWADTICIDKSSSAELDESIRSMFSWYRNAAICIAYLAETNDLRDLTYDHWFTRGWTLQELLAPRYLKFYTKNWHPLTDFPNDKMLAEDVRKLNIQSLSRQLDFLCSAIGEATGISMHHVRDFVPGIRHPPLPQRMQWIARRVTTREEDQSYSLMGIFNVSIPIAYGEGRERAFFRLFQAVLEVGYERDWFLWTGKSISQSIHPSRMIPSSPKCYLGWNVEFGRCAPGGRMVCMLENEPLHLTNVGLPMKVLFVPVKLSEPGKTSRYRDYTSSDAFVTCALSNQRIKIRGIYRSCDADASVREEFALAVLNVNPEEKDAPCPDRLYAVLLQRPAIRESPTCLRENWVKCSTDNTITFECHNKIEVFNAEAGRPVTVDRGMQNNGRGVQVRSEKMRFCVMSL